MEFCTKTTDKQGYKHRVFAWPRGWRTVFSGKAKRVLPPGFNVWVYSLLLLLFMALPALASLPPSVVVSGSSNTYANGTYTSNGTSYTYSSNVSYSLQYISNQGGSGWQLYSPTAGLASSTGGQTSASPVGTYTGGVNVALPVSPPTGTFGASPTSIQSGASSTLTWSTSGATTVTLATGAAAPVSVAASGSQSVSPSATTSYEIAATNSAGTVYSDATVTVLAPTVSSVQASPTSLTGSTTTAQTVTLTATLSGPAPTGGATVTWSSTTTGGFAGNVGFTAQQTIPAGQTSCSETATVGASSSSGSIIFSGAYGSSSQTATVTVGAPAAASQLPATVYITGSSVASLNGTYTQDRGAAVPHYATSSGAIYAFTSPNWSLYAASGGSSVVYYVRNSTDNTAVTGSLSPFGGGATGTAIVSTTAPTPPPSGGSTSGPAGSPGVSISASPYTIAPGSSSVLRWDTSGATTQSVTGVANASASGTVNVSPTSTTTYTISATNSTGTNTQSVTVTVDSTLPGTSGGSTFTPGTVVSTSGGTFAPPTLPGLTIAPVTLPGYGSFPPLTIPGINLPPISLPGLSLPGMNSPGDLKIGIPGIGSINIPTGWLSQLIQFAINPASIAQQLSTYNAAQFDALATYNAGAAVTNAVNNGTATLQQINTVSQNQNLDAHNQTMSVLNSTAATTQSVITSTATATQTNENNNFTSMLTAGPGGLLTKLFQYLFIPDQATLQSVSAAVTDFFNWGPVTFAQSLVTLFQPAPGMQVTGAPILPFARQAPHLETGPNADLSRPHALYHRSSPNGSVPMVLGGAAPVPVYGQPLPDPGTDLAIPLMQPIQGETDTYNVLTGFTRTPTVTWTNTGQKVAFDFTPMTNAPFWPFLRLMLGAGVYLAFGLGVMRKIYPRLMF